MANPLPVKRAALESIEYLRSNIPLVLRGATLEQVPESVRSNITAYLKKIHEVKQKVAGLYLYGPSGVGKTGIGVLILKEARLWGYTAYLHTIPELREAIETKAMFDLEDSVASRARYVDFLVIDDLKPQDFVTKFPLTSSEVRSLIRKREDYGLITIITSTLAPGEWGSEYPDIANALGKVCLALEVTGPIRHEQELEARSSVLRL